MLTGCGGSSSTSNPPADLHGEWGGGTSSNPLTLNIKTGGGTLTFSCGAYDELTQTLVTDSQGNFDVIATQHSSLPMGTLPGSSLPQVHLVGIVTGRTMTISEELESVKGAVQTLTYGQSSPSFSGGCPG